MKERERERERMGTTDLGMIWRINVYLTVVDGYVLMWGVACRYIGKWGSGVWHVGGGI